MSIEDVICEITAEGYNECDVKIDQLFKRGRGYRIVSKRPYLVVETELRGHYAFLDTGFSGKVERSDIDTHTNRTWGIRGLNEAYSGSESRILMVGLGAMKGYSSMFIDYVNLELMFGVNVPEGAEEVRVLRSFSNFESEMFAIDTVAVKNGVKAGILSFVDTGNPESFIMNGALSNELKEFNINSTCECSQGIKQVHVEDTSLSLRSEQISIVIEGRRVLDSVRIVCEKGNGGCSSKGYNNVIRNPLVNPQVGINLGNDALSKFSFVFIDFSAHRFYVGDFKEGSSFMYEPSQPVSRQFISSGDEPSICFSLGWGIGISFVVLTALILIQYQLGFRRKK